MCTSSTAAPSALLPMNPVLRVVNEPSTTCTAPPVGPASLLRNSLQYSFYVTGCGRYQRLDSLWGNLRKH